MDNNQQSFWRFSDQLRVQSSNIVNSLSNDSIWSNSYGSKKTDERRNFDMRVGGEPNSIGSLKPKDSPVFGDGWNSFSGLKPEASELNGFDGGWSSSLRALKGKGSDLNSFRNSLNSLNPEGSGSNDSWNSFKSLKPKGSDLNSWSSASNLKPKGSDLNLFNGWKMGSSGNDFVVGPLAPVDHVAGGSQNNGGFNKGIYSENHNINKDINVNSKGSKNKGEDDHGAKSRKKNGSKKNNSDNKDGNENKSGVDKKLKTLPAAESLPRNETIGGYIFVCNNDTMQENLKRKLFGLPPRYRDSVRQITPGLPLFLYNYTNHQLHGIFEAASFGGTNIDASAWQDKKCPGESRFPAQVRVVNRKTCEPLEEDSFRPILHHYDGPKFRLELNIPEALSLLDKFDEQDH